MCKFSLFVFLLILLECQGNFKVTHEWRYVNFTWPDVETYEAAIASGKYIPENNFIHGVKYFNNYYYLSIPRLRHGVPATLTRFPIAKGDVIETSPNLEPFPTWGLNEPGNCGGLQSVHNVEIDSRGQMWIIDSGQINIFGQYPFVKCDPKIVVYNFELEIIQLVHIFPKNVTSKFNAILYDLVIDETDGGFVYITDNSRVDPGIVVYSMRENKSWKIRDNPTMRGDISASRFDVGNDSLNWLIGIAGIALGPIKDSTNIREVFYSPLSSLQLYSINSTILKNIVEFDGIVKNYGKKGSQSAAMIADNRGNLYYGSLQTGSVIKWNITSGTKINLVRDGRQIEWTSSFTFDTGDKLTVLANSNNRFGSYYNRMEINLVNFRLITGYVGAKGYLQLQNTKDSEKFNTTSKELISKICTQFGTPKPSVYPTIDNRTDSL